MKKEHFQTKQEYDLVIHWKITDFCNFSCPGCSGQTKKAGRKYIPEKIDISAFKKILAGLDRTIKILFTGGEPLLIENIIEVFEEVTSENYMALITNLTNPKVKVLSERINPERVEFIKASAHLLELEKRQLLDTFLDHYNMLQDKGFHIYTEEVAYPVMADKVEKYKKIFFDRGIELKFQAYRGLWQEKQYPEAYTKKEYSIFNFSDIGAATTAIHNRKDKKCNAGYNVVVGFHDGRICRCYGIPDYMGNLFTGFKLDDTLISCPLDYCDCPLSLFDPHLFEMAIEETKSPILMKEQNF